MTADAMCSPFDSVTLRKSSGVRTAAVELELFAVFSGLQVRSSLLRGWHWPDDVRQQIALARNQRFHFVAIMESGGPESTWQTDNVLQPCRGLLQRNISSSSSRSSSQAAPLADISSQQFSWEKSYRYSSCHKRILDKRLAFQLPKQNFDDLYARTLSPDVSGKRRLFVCDVTCKPAMTERQLLIKTNLINSLVPLSIEKLTSLLKLKQNSIINYSNKNC